MSLAHNAPLADYEMFLDDERMPSSAMHDAVIVRSYNEFAKAIRERGIPRYISFDHDLGRNQKTGKDCANFLVSKMMYYKPTNLDEFQFYVHSQNPVGAANIRSYLEQFLESHATQHD